MTSFAQDERARLVETAREAGPEHATLCGEWTVLELLEHLAVREGSATGAIGIVVPPLEPLTTAAMARVGRRGFDALLRRVAHPPLWSPSRLAPVDRLINSVELFIHHEDIRRAAPDWEPRTLTDTEQQVIWKGIALPGKGLVRPAGVPVTLRWAGTDREQVLGKGEEPVVVGGAPGELAMFLFGRAQHRDLTFDGPPEKVAALESADLSA